MNQLTDPLYPLCPLDLQECPSLGHLAVRAKDPPASAVSCKYMPQTFMAQ